ncbi:DNA polymerase gamma [Penicillium verhagenii]|nr:DNA polymerase gamma [Penicillium verhagenii]
MSTFEEADIAFIKAQITKDDKEVRDIIKEKTRSLPTTKPPDYTLFFSQIIR